MVTIASLSRAPPLRGNNSKAAKRKIRKSLPVTALKTGPITNTGCLLLDVDFDEALRFVGEGYTVRRPHATNHIFSMTFPDAEVGVHVSSMRYGLRFSRHELIVQFLNFYCLLPGQLSPHSYYCFSTFLIKCHLKGVPWSLDLFRYMFKVSRIGAREGNSYAVVSSQNECGMVVVPISLKLWKAKFVFIPGFLGARHPFQARFPECHSFNLAKVGTLISLERQFELAKAVQGGRPKHGLEETASGLSMEESEEVDEDEEIEADEESGQPSYSEDAADAEPSEGDISRSTSIIPDLEVVLTRNKRRRKTLQVKEEEAVSEQDVVLTQSLPAKRPVVPEDGKFSALLDESGRDVQAEAEAASLTTVSTKLSLIKERRAGAEFFLGVNFLASVEAELSRLRKLAAAEHEQVAELEMQAVTKSEEVVRLHGLLRESEESTSQLTTSMAELEGKLRQSEGRIAEMDVELAEAISLQRSLEAERDQAFAEKEEAVAEKERAFSNFLQSPAFKEACMDKFVEYYDSWIETEADIKKIGNEGPRWIEAGVYYGIQLVLQRFRRVDPSFPPPGVDIPYMHDPSLNGELGSNPDYFGTPEREDENADAAGEDHPSDCPSETFP
ncbi:unnamed protein product [Cuscuta campestris]|uniref:Transposase (putative) gypsy type domain-containing protein n=1 Tax=Cuscuta campestris TaxID=132261 RepID=A0A484L2F9_9ASTE|nr:unnamed protein product [Cuscuta campestris]